MAKILTFLFLLPVCVTLAQTDSVALKEIKKFQDELNEQYRTPGKSPLPEKEIAAFKGHEFFPVNMRFRVNAKLIRTPNEKPFIMKTANKDKEYIKYGELHFMISGKEYQLNVYQSILLRQQDEFKDYLFLPFRDLTSGETSYGGGRYIDLRIPEGDTLVLDFNQAYNPYCAYTIGYSCPIPPKENFLELKVEAGIKYTDH